MQKLTRNHHYVPQAYLAQFTDTGTRAGKLYAFPVTGAARFRSSPRNVAAKRDFNRIDVGGYSPDALEHALGEFEHQAIQAIRQTISANAFPSDKNYSLIINLICLLAVKNPRLRDSFNGAQDSLMRRVARETVRDKSRWDSIVRQARQAGATIADDVTYDQMVDFITRDNYDIDFSTDGSLRLELGTISHLLSVLAKRTWTILLAPENGPQFVSSDHPVVLSCSDGRQAFGGFDRPHSEVLFPLGPSMAFIGVLERPLPAVARLKSEGVAALNLRTARNAVRHIFSREPSFFILRAGELYEIRT